MRKGILVIIMLMFGTFSNAQFVVDTTEVRLLSLERITKDLNDKNIILMNNLDRYQSQRKIAIEHLAMGFGLTTIGTALFLANKQEQISKLCFTSGGIFMLIGGIIEIDSGKWITDKKRVRKGLPKPETKYEELIIDK